PQPSTRKDADRKPYVIAPPDILTIEVLRLPPGPAYRVEPGEELTVRVSDAPDGPVIGGRLTVTPKGDLDLGDFGTVRVAGLTLAKIEAAVRDRVTRTLVSAQV